MPNRELIHSSSDVVSTLFHALDLGLQIRLDEPQPKPRPQLLNRREIPGIHNGVFILFRPEWIFGRLQFRPITGGHNSGKFSVAPSVNYSAITLYFGGERLDQGKRRLGGCLISFHRDWLELPAKAVRPTPPEVGVWFKKIIAHMASGVVIKAGVHKYLLCRGVASDPNADHCLPPFDFIPWSNELIHGSAKRKTTTQG